MPDSSSYYQCDPDCQTTSRTGRFPTNHVHFSNLLKPLIIIDKLYRCFGMRAFTLTKQMLKEFDSAEPLGDYFGTKDDIMKTRKVIELLCLGVDRNPHLSPEGRHIIKVQSMRSLKTRKKILDFYRENREFIETNGSMKKPLIITGTPRSGTTLLQRLISEDPNTRSPSTFELESPLPPMKPGENIIKNKRIKKSSTGISMMKFLAPGFIEKLSESHRVDPTEMEESLLYMFIHNGLNPMLFRSGGRNLSKDLNDGSVKSIFEYERIFFTLLDAYMPAKSHWTLKAPIYALFFSNIFDQYDDANVVITHRNPLITLPSTCRLAESVSITFDQNGSFDKHKFGAHLESSFDRFFNVPLAYRNDNPGREKQIFDCMYSDLVSDPITMVKNIYKRFDLEYKDEFEIRMKRYLEKNRQGRYGRHKYSLEEYGFQSENLHNKYKDYMERYGYGIPVSNK